MGKSNKVNYLNLILIILSKLRNRSSCAITQEERGRPTYSVSNTKKSCGVDKNAFIH